MIREQWQEVMTNQSRVSCVIEYDQLDDRRNCSYRHRLNQRRGWVSYVIDHDGEGSIVYNVSSVLENFAHQINHLLTQPAAVPFVFAFIGGLFVYQIKQRRLMLAVKAGVDVLYGVHFLMMAAYAGAWGVMIAVFGGLVQIMTPDHLMQRTLLYRNIVAATLALLGAFVAMKHTTDVLPLVAATSARFVETQSQAQRIRFGMGVILVLWIAYAIQNNLYLMFIAHATALISLLLALYRHRASTD